jgi:hypothetical protein
LDPHAFDEYIGAKIMIQQGSDRVQGRVTKRFKEVTADLSADETTIG